MCRLSFAVLQGGSVLCVDRSIGVQVLGCRCDCVGVSWLVIAICFVWLPNVPPGIATHNSYTLL